MFCELKCPDLPRTKIQGIFFHLANLNIQCEISWKNHLTSFFGIFLRFILKVYGFYSATSGANVSVVCDIIDIDTTLSYELTSSNSEGISLTTSTNLKKTNSTTFTHSTSVNPTFTNLEVINRTIASHSEQTSTDFNIQPTDVTKYQKIAESVSGMKGNIYIVYIYKEKPCLKWGWWKRMHSLTWNLLIFFFSFVLIIQCILYCFTYMFFFVIKFTHCI